MVCYTGAGCSIQPHSPVVHQSPGWHKINFPYLLFSESPMWCWIVFFSSFFWRTTFLTTRKKIQATPCTLFSFLNPRNKHSGSSTVTSTELQFKEICPSVLCDQHCIVHIRHVLKVLQASRSDLFPWVTSPPSKPSYSSNMLSVACMQK